MNNHMLIELADGWQMGADLDRTATSERRETLRECADMLRMLVQLDKVDSAGKPLSRRFAVGDIVTPRRRLWSREGFGVVHTYARAGDRLVVTIVREFGYLPLNVRHADGATDEDFCVDESELDQFVEPVQSLIDSPEYVKSVVDRPVCECDYCLRPLDHCPPDASCDEFLTRRMDALLDELTPAEYREYQRQAIDILVFL